MVKIQVIEDWRQNCTRHKESYEAEQSVRLCIDSHSLFRLKSETSVSVAKDYIKCCVISTFRSSKLKCR